MPARPVTRLALALLALALLESPARADDLPAAGWRPLKVGVLDVRSYAVAPADLYGHRPVVANLQSAAEVWQKRLEQTLATLDQVRLVGVADVRSRLSGQRGFRDAKGLGASYYELGAERYAALQRGEALAALERSQHTYERAYVDVVAPDKVAEVYFMRGLALIEEGQPELAHIAFRRALALDPSRTLRRGYYTESTEKAFAGALTDLVGQSDRARLTMPVPRLAALASKLGVDVWVSMAIEGTPEDPVLQLSLFDRKSRGIVLSERIELGDEEAATLRLERALTAWHTCAVEEASTAGFSNPQSRAKWYVEVGYTHTMFLEHDTRELFHSPGALIAVTWEVEENLLLFARTVQMVSLPDANEDLVDDFVTGRLALGAGLVGGSPDIRGYVEAGPEVGVTFSDAVLTRDPNCKHFGVGDPLCSGVDRIQAPAFWFGLHLGTGLRWRFAGDWYAHLSASITFLLLDQDLAGRLNFPLSLSAGIGSRF